MSGSKSKSGSGKMLKKNKRKGFSINFGAAVFSAGVVMSILHSNLLYFGLCFTLLGALATGQIIKLELANEKLMEKYEVKNEEEK